MQKYEVRCLKCKQSDVLLIDDNNHAIVNYGKGINTNLLAGRWRKDMKWGWECICGNDNRISLVEKDYIVELVQKGTPKTIEDIKKSLKIDDKKQFVMVGVS